MSIQHLSMVFNAEGLTSSQKLLLLAYCNYTDAHGYCWAGVERIADDIGASVRTVKRIRRELTTLNLIGTKRRTNPKTGQAISNLTRVNLTQLAAMKRPSRTYDDNVVEQITFAEPDPASPESDTTDKGGEPPEQTPSDQQKCKNDTWTEQQKCQCGTSNDNLSPGRCQIGTCNRGAKLAPNPSVIRHLHPPREETSRVEEEEETNQGPNAPRGPVAVITRGTDATTDEARQLVEQVRAQPNIHSVAAYVRTLVDNGDMAERLRRLRDSASPNGRSPRTELCGEHTRPLPCVFCAQESRTTAEEGACA